MRVDEFTKKESYDEILERPLDPQTLYIQQNADIDKWRWMYFLCPCGCGDELNVCLMSTIAPHWDFEEHEDGTISISPSVQYLNGCRSHFFIKHNKVIWA